jgi:hypothetical protein
MSIADTTSAIKNMWDLFSDANEIANKSENLDLQRKLNQLQQQIILLERQLIDKDRVLLEYERKEYQKQNLTFQDNLYWKIDEQDNKEGPFCPKCKDGDQKEARMTTSEYLYICPVCRHAHRHTEQPKPQR